MDNRNMETVLQYINKNFVTVADGDIKHTNVILSKVLDDITVALRSVSTLFNHLFETYIYGGSFFDGLKVSKPDEFDIDLKLLLPKILDVQLEPSDKDGFVYVKLKDWNRLQSDTTLYNIYKDLEKLKDSENYLSQDKVKRWMQGIVQEAINKILEEGTLDDIELKYKMSGPAVTLKVTHNYQTMDIDLVAVFRMPGEKWPEAPVRQNTNKIWKDFLVVPKCPKDIVLNSERYWRLSFPEQEREIIKRLNCCKPALRLLKKLRDTGHHSIPSYFIKTVFLWEIENREKNNNAGFWNSSLTNVFVEMLDKYKTCLERHEIPYFWNANNNFLELMSDTTINNIKNNLSRILRDIRHNMITDPYVAAKYLLPPSELGQLRRHFHGVIQDRTEREACAPNWLNQPRVSMPGNRNAGNMAQKETGMSTSSKIAVGAAAATGILAVILGGVAVFANSGNRDDRDRDSD